MRMHHAYVCAARASRSWKRHDERGPHAELALHCDGTACIFHHFLDHAQADARALDVVVQALEYTKEPGLLVGVQAQAVVRHFEHYGGFVTMAAQLHHGGAARVPIFHGIAGQVIDDNTQVFRQKRNRGASLDREPDASSRQHRGQIQAHALNQRSQVNLLGHLGVGLLLSRALAARALRQDVAQMFSSALNIPDQIYYET